MSWEERRKKGFVVRKTIVVHEAQDKDKARIVDNVEYLYQIKGHRIC